MQQILNSFDQERTDMDSPSSTDGNLLLMVFLKSEGDKVTQHSFFFFCHWLLEVFHLDSCSSCETGRTPPTHPAAPERSPPSTASWPEVREAWDASEENKPTLFTLMGRQATRNHKTYCDK